MFTTSAIAPPNPIKGAFTRLTGFTDLVTPLSILGILAFAILCGLAIPILGILVPAVVGALMLSIVTLALPTRAIIWLMLVLIFLVVGQLSFFVGLQQAFWLPYLLLLLISVKWPMELLRVKTHLGPRQSLSPILLAIGLFCLSFFASALANGTGFASVAVAAKNYLLPWFLTLLVASAIERADDIRAIWKFMLWIVVLQVPFAVPQHFYFAKRAGASWDAVVGSFGGNYLTGGASGTMAIFLIFGILLAVSLYRRQQIRIQMLIAVVTSALTTVALAEVKVFFIAMPLGLLLLFRKSVLTNPLRSVAYGLLSAALLVVVLLAYQQTYSESVTKTDTIDGLADYVFSAESDPYFFNPETGELSRIGAMQMWYKYNDVDDSRFYIGHGPAASRASRTLGEGVAARQYPFTLTTSSASQVLWDTGLVSYGLLLGILLTGAISAFRLARQAPAAEAAVLESIAVILLLNLPLTLYNRDLIESSATQPLIALWLGFVLLCRKSIASGARGAAPAADLKVETVK